MDLLFIIGRVLFAAIFINSAVGHFAAREAMTGYAKSKKVPAAGAAVVSSGVLILLGAVSLLLGFYPDLGALALIVFLVPAAFLMHNFWGESEPMARMNELIAFLKDLGLAGAALLILLMLQSGADFGPMLTDLFF
jgi:uncharacterized membrane protein YphA (DoxX/SURF4 family)